MVGLPNAYNIIDGFNDPVLASTCLIVLGAIGGFFIWNYPRGLILLGDGGAYLIGFLIACLSILLVQRNPAVSPWLALLVNAHPILKLSSPFGAEKFIKGKIRSYLMALIFIRCFIVA